MPLIPSKLADPKVRAYLYRVLLAIGALLVVYGFVSEQELGYWVVLGAALLGNGTATYNTPRPRSVRQVESPQSPLVQGHVVELDGAEILRAINHHQQRRGRPDIG